MSTAHLISGLPCAGKSTYAQQLQLRTGAVVFTLDRFLITMFGRYDVPDVGGQERVRRVLACREVIWMSAEKLLVLGSDVILDDGYFRRDHRRSRRRCGCARCGGEDSFHPHAARRHSQA